MKKSVRKLLSVLMAACLLCAVLPMGGMMSVSAATKTEVTAADNRISNGDFECWKNNGSGRDQPVFWHGGAFDGRGQNSYAIIHNASSEASSMYQTIAVDSGVTYKLTFQACAVSGKAFKVRITDGDNVTLEKECFAAADWNQYVCLFPYEGTLQEAKLEFYVEKDATEIWIDDVTLNYETKNITESLGFSYDGYVFNGDFETGSKDFWTVSGGEIVTFDGDYALKSTTTSRYNTVAEQTITVEADTDYTLDVKSYYNGSLTGGIARVHIFAGASGTSELASPSYYWNITAGAWNNHQLTFNSGANTQVRIVLQQHAAPNSSTAMNGNIYYDDFVVKKASDEPTASTPKLIQNGDFETGNLTGWKSGYSGVVQSAVVHSGSYAHKTTNTASKYQGMMQQNPVKVAANSDYIVTFWYYYEGNNATGSGASFYLYAQTTDNKTNLNSKTNYPAAANTWYQVTMSFNSGSNTEIALVWSNRMVSDGGTYYFDDVVMTGPIPESGDSSETPVDPEEPVVPEIPDGAHYFYSNKTYTVLHQQNFSATEGKTYKITFSARAITNGFRLLINGETNNDLFWSENIRSWKPIELYYRVNTSEMSIELRTLGNGTVGSTYNGNVETNFYISDIQVVEIPDTEVNLLEHGGKSAMEMNETGAVGGLGFLFSANIKDFQYANDNSQTEHLYTVYKYAEQSGKANPYISTKFPNDPYDYTVVRMGAIVSNKLGEVADTDLTIKNAVDRSNTINIVGAKAMKELCDDTGDYVYGVRVTNIPEGQFGRTIYARPYITILIGGEEVTLYGDMVSASYQEIMGEVA
ncbi:MAG: carbohydrate binding domain-containing protein [Clostridia bacterium]|nr:carbohydrate binding domain-containing protein [Clostridia bacterium]